MVRYRLRPREVCRPGILGLALLLPGFPARSAPLAAQQAQAALAFRGVTVIDVADGRRLPEQTVVVVGNRVQAMGPAGQVQVPAGAQVVDATGKYLIPGLWDLHVHMRYLTELFHRFLVANGVTGIRDAGSEIKLDQQIQWRREILAGTRVGPPRQILSGRPIKDGSSCDQSNNFYYACVSSDTDVVRIADSLRTAGADMLKTYDLPAEWYFAVAAAARRGHIPFGGHAGAVSAIDASDSGASILDHVSSAGDINSVCLGDDATVKGCQAVAERFRRNHTWFAPSVAFGPTGGPRTRRVSAYFSQRLHDFWAGTWAGTPLQGNWLSEWVHFTPPADSDDGAADPSHHSPPADSAGYMDIMHRVGLPIVAATDVYPEGLKALTPGFALHAELAMYQAEGFTPAEVLRSATLNPAELLHATDSLGTVAPGKLADLVLLDADPLVDITNTTTIRAVVANGRYFDRATLDDMLTKARAEGKDK